MLERQWSHYQLITHAQSIWCTRKRYKLSFSAMLWNNLKVIQAVHQTWVAVTLSAFKYIMHTTTVFHPSVHLHVHAKHSSSNGTSENVTDGRFIMRSFRRAAMRLLSCSRLFSSPLNSAHDATRPALHRMILRGDLDMPLCSPCTRKTQSAANWREEREGGRTM